MHLTSLGLLQIKEHFLSHFWSSLMVTKKQEWKMLLIFKSLNQFAYCFSKFLLSHNRYPSAYYRFALSRGQRQPYHHRVLIWQLLD